MAIAIFQGTYVTAEDANSYIDIGTITSGCSMLTEGAAKLSGAADKIQNVKSLCGSDALSFQGTTLVSAVESCASNASSSASSISSLASSILSAAQRALDKKQVELNETARAEEARQRSIHQQSGS